MELDEVLEWMAEGHGVVTEEAARQACDVLGVLFNSQLVMRWQGAQEAGERYGLVPLEDGPGSGVGALELSYYVAAYMGLGAPGSHYIGKGYQARANVRAIRQKLQERAGI